jgi:plastocyanin
MHVDFRARGLRSFTWLLLLGAYGHCATAAVHVTVVDDHGEPVEHVAVYAAAAGTKPAPPANAPTASMDQAHNAFVPHILVVETGTAVLFPNNDTVSHHVYSFSPSKAFELGLYKGNVYPPLMFEQPGVVVLGCNIHDGMLGYILVVDTPHFALTNDRGEVTFDALPAGRYSIEAWTPRIRPDRLPTAVTVDTAPGGGNAALQSRLEGKLAPEHEHGKSSLSWKRY